MSARSHGSRLEVVNKPAYSTEKLYSLFRKQSPEVVDNVGYGEIEKMFEMPGLEVDSLLCKGLDYYYRAHTRRLIRMPDHEEELLAFLEHIEHQEAVEKFDEVRSPQGVAYGAKWRCLGELVEDQMEVYESIHAERLFHRRHVEEILQFLLQENAKGNKVTQTDIGNQVGISKSHLSDLMRPMQEVGWIEKTKIGVRNLVCITTKGVEELKAHVKAQEQRFPKELERFFQMYSDKKEEIAGLVEHAKT